MADAGKEVERMLLFGSYLSSQVPVVPFISSLTNEFVQRKQQLNAAYWRSSYDSPVLFNTALEKLLETRSSTNPPLLLEIGPHSALAGPIRQILKAAKSGASYVPTLVRNENATCSMLNAAGQLFLKGVKLDFRALNPGGQVLTDLPRYPWHHESRYWHESRLSKQWRLRRFPHHDLLGSQVPECSGLEPVWRNVLRLNDVPWCREHVIAGDIVFPGAGYISMAGEAIRQTSNPDSEIQDYTLRDFSLSAAMALHESAATEIMFTMRPFRLTTSLDSNWYDFTVMSYNDSSGIWTKHCTGQVRAGSEHPPVPRGIVDLPRKVHSTSWYQLMKKFGMSYGRRFQGMEKISAHPVHHLAVTHVWNTISETDSVYQLHPVTIDSCIQLFTVAACRGQAMLFNVALVPTRFGEIYIKRPSSNAKVAVQVNADTSIRGGIDGSCFGIANNEIVMVLKDVTLSPLGDSAATRDKDSHAGVCLQWKPDIGFQNIGSLISSCSTMPTLEERFPDLQRLLLLCSIEARCRLNSHGEYMSEQICKYLGWLNTEIPRVIAGEDSKGVEDLLTLSSVDRVDLIMKTVGEINKTQVAAIGTAVCHVLDAVRGIVGKSRPLELFRRNDILTNVYKLMDGFRSCRSFLQLLSHAKPHLRILEIGAGAGATQTILDSLTSDFGERMFYSYTLTDCCTEVLDAARERFKDVDGMEFLQFDITKQPEEQGLSRGTFDLVIAGNVSIRLSGKKDGQVTDIKLSFRSCILYQIVVKHLGIFDSSCNPMESYFYRIFVRTRRG
jgi:acyl transferase domain-containing protein